MNKRLRQGMGLGIAIAVAALSVGGEGCDYKAAGQSSIFIPVVGCEYVPVCGTVCSDKLDSGRRLITLNGQERTGEELKKACRLSSVCEIDEEGTAYDGLCLRQ